MLLPRRLAWVYFALFMAVVAITHAPGLTDEQGYNLGLFKIDPIDDVIHLLSGLLAGFAALQSERVALWYFRLFGAIYGLDFVVGTALTGALLPNVPHLAIALAALGFGFLLVRPARA